MEGKVMDDGGKEVMEKGSCCESSADQATRCPTGPWTPYRGLECEVRQVYV